MAYDLLTKKQTKRDWSCGSLLLPVKQQKVLLQKIDDVRYDVRNAGRKASIGLLCLSASLGLLGFASIYRSTKLPGSPIPR